MISFNKDAVFSDETQQFVTPYDPMPGDNVQFNLRTGKDNFDAIHLHTCEGEAYQMSITTSDILFDYYTANIIAPSGPVRYYYSITHGGDVFFYNKDGLQCSLNQSYNFRLIPGANVPSWAKGVVMYQIFTDRFKNGDPTNDVVNHEYAYLELTAKSVAWDSDVTVPDVCNFRGGDLRGIMQKMGYLQSLGVEVIYLNPIFVSPSNHKYDAQDYDYVDPHFGVITDDGGETLRFEHVHNRHATKYRHRVTSKANLEASNRLMAEFIEQAHYHGIRVILDGVFNHCGCFNKWMDRHGFYQNGQNGQNGGYPTGAFHSTESPYRDYFIWNDDGTYSGWWDNPNHPKLNYEGSKNLCDYILKVAAKWVSPPYNADGWRLDVAADLGRSPAFNHEFWKKFRDAVKHANPEALILAEHYGDPSPWLNGDQWDTVMNYDAFMEPITWFLTGVCKHSEASRPHLKNDAVAFKKAMGYHMSKLNIHALETAMNQLSNHDHSRFLTRTNGTTGRLHTMGPRAAETGTSISIMMEAVVFQMTWPGAPTIYYGDEAGLAGWTDPDNRRTFPWRKEDQRLTELHRALIGLRRVYTVLKTGSVDFLWSAHGFISYGRWDERQKLVVALNNNPSPIEVVLPVWKLGVVSGQMIQLLTAYNENFNQDNIWYNVNDGELRITVPGFGATVLG